MCRLQADQMCFHCKHDLNFLDDVIKDMAQAGVGLERGEGRKQDCLSILAEGMRREMEEREEKKCQMDGKKKMEREDVSDKRK